MQNDMELLAPAGSMEALRAALANGADAVYLGAAAFGARASAGFDENTLRDALHLAHLHRKKVYVTVNILIKETELSDLRATFSLLSRLGADAVLLQDLGALKICREEFPQLPVHASTQMALHNAAGVSLLRDLGARRAVLARECSLSEIRKAADTGLEIEVFCHGALCVSASGQCLFSSMIGGRSGNRGRCAQPCRLSYAYQGKTGAWLSPRDLCGRDLLPALWQAGAYSLKIEGRLKRPEYVAVVTRAYRRALDATLEGRFSPADGQEMDALRQIFSRGGFSGGYLDHKRDAAIIDETRVTPAGLDMGTIGKVYQKGGARLADLSLLRPLHNGDGLEVGTQQIRYSGPEMAAGQTAALRLREAARPGEAVRRTEDESQLSAARATYAGEALNQALSIPFDATLSAYPGAPLSLTVSDGESALSVQGEICLPAENKPLDEASAGRALSKTGGTPFALRSLTLKTQGAFVSVSALNALRREALDQLTAVRIAAAPGNAVSPISAHAFIVPQRKIPAPRLIARTNHADEIPALREAGADEILFAPEDMRREALEKILPALPGGTRLCLPAQCAEETLRMLHEAAKAAKLSVCLSSPGQLGLPWQAPMAGEGIPVMNGEAIRALSALGCESVTVSRELCVQDIAALPADIVEMILPVYGRARLMLLNHCPMRTRLGLTENRAHCGLCEQGKGARGTCLTDRMGASYPLSPTRLPEGCLIALQSATPLHLGSRLSALPGRFSYLIAFTDETPAQRLALTAYYKALLRGEKPAPLSIQGTAGRFEEGVL